MLTQVALVKVVDRTGGEVGVLLESRGGYLEVQMADGSSRWFIESLVLSRNPEVVRLGICHESVGLYGLKTRPAPRVQPEFFLG